MEMPAAPAPTMQRSAVKASRSWSLRASMNTVSVPVSRAHLFRRAGASQGVSGAGLTRAPSPPNVSG